MDKTYYNTLAHNIYQLKEAGEVIRALQDLGIPVIVLKGAALVETVYHDPGIRPMADIDLLVSPCNLNKAEKILRELNFTLAPTGELHYIKRHGSLFTQIDLHWDIWYLKDQREVWQSAIKVKVGNVGTLVMSPEDAIIYIVAHSTVHHGMLRPIWVEDISRLINHYKTLDWDEVIEKVNRYNLKVPVFYFFSWLKRLGNRSPIPPNVMKRLVPPLSKKLEYKVFSSVLNSPAVDDTGHILRFLLEKGLYGKIKSITMFLFPAPSFLKRRYNLSNNYKAYLYYFIRPFYLIINTFKLIIRMA